MADIADLLHKTSRTFALAIPTLPVPARQEVGLAYLLFRVVDTLEDAELWSRARRLVAIGEFADVLQQPATAPAVADAWLATPPTAHAGYLELLRELPGVLAATAALTAPARAAILRHARRTAEGMARFVARSCDKGTLALTSLADLRDYCYVVAGIVGELLTDVFLLGAPQLEAVKPELTRTMAAFGEGLQLVNILKDAVRDADDGRIYLPPNVPAQEVFDLATHNLDMASEYVEALQRGGAPRGFLTFTGLALVLARSNLIALHAHGAGAKVSREQVATLWAKLEADLDAGRPMRQATA